MIEKLIRDKIIDRILAHGEKLNTRIATREEMPGLLADKLREEVTEFVTDPSPEEMADILEVLDALRVEYGWSRRGVQQARAKKRRERGGFAKRFVLRVAPPR